MEGTLRSNRLPAVVFLLFCTLPSRVDAQQFVCWPIANGDTASSLARRLTGKSEAAYSLAFQIRDPARQMFVPKSHYQRLQSDWQACVSPEPVSNTPAAYAPVVELAAAAPVMDAPVMASPPVALTSAPLTVTRADRTNIYGSVAGIAGAALLFIVLLSAAASVAPRPIPPAARRAGEDFVAVFARPLIEAPSERPPIQTRLRFKRRKELLEIYIKPTPGHRYPNLTDHKKNFEYDIDRVMRVLGNYALSQPPRVAGKWVVVTIKEMSEQ